MRVYYRLGIGDDTFITFASGGAFTKYSHEFQTICDAGEDVIFMNREKNVALNEEIATDEALAELGVTRDELEKVKTAEVGNIFNFGTQKSEDTKFTFTDEHGIEQLVHLGSYGIGITRVMGVIVEKFSDEKGIVWPEAIAPAKVYIARLGNDSVVVNEADKLYDDLTKAGISVLYDDRDARPGEKFADADLLGIPYRVVVSNKTVEAKQYEIKQRTQQQATMISEADMKKLLTATAVA
jgi:prolyl-tRNA synthetase